MHKINNRKRIKKCGSNRGKGRGKKAKQEKIAKRAVKIDAEVKWALVDRANGFARENSSMVNRTYTHTHSAEPATTFDRIRSTKQNAQVLFYSILKFTGWV